MGDLMDCSQAEPWLDEYAAGELAETERAAVDVHLDRCAECRRALQQLRALDAAIRNLPTPSVPEGFLAAIQTKLPRDRFGLDQRATAPSAWFDDDEAVLTYMDEYGSRVARIAA